MRLMYVLSRDGTVFYRARAYRVTDATARGRFYDRPDHASSVRSILSDRVKTLFINVTIVHRRDHGRTM